MKIDLNKKALLQDELDRAGCHEEASKIAAEFLMEAEKNGLLFVS